MKKTLLIIAGFLSLILGGIGIVLPVLPTTPFVLLAATCFGSSSPVLYNRLRNNKYFGQYIEHYKSGTGISKAVKIQSLIFLWVMLFLSGYLIKNLTICFVLALVGLGVTIHILTLKTKVNVKEKSDLS